MKAGRILYDSPVGLFLLMNTNMRSSCQLSLILYAASLHMVLAQEPLRRISGSVYDVESRQMLPGAYIRVVGTNMGTTSNADGAYRLLLPAGNYQIAASYPVICRTP